MTLEDIQKKASQDLRRIPCQCGKKGLVQLGSTKPIEEPRALYGLHSALYECTDCGSMYQETAKALYRYEMKSISFKPYQGRLDRTQIEAGLEDIRGILTIDDEEEIMASQLPNDF